ncbi:sigma-70 family RNA polymerase sigma factor [Kineosporia rhizophila]|uniref:RNA polymerase sigma factor n=1 Tax=Kineosporia TaxID=49184 RepID=UPI001E3B2F53|nr:sigma-70 family RNA polymerase sigma factor [Kineosporia sp. NBRC 101677]MCE0534001.1 sigma-70 family RNA polymerase sigma factor [Kineosporia rhizophila]
MGNTTAGGTGAGEAFRRLYSDNFGAILRYALRRVRDPDDAADLVADIFLVAWRRYDELPPGVEARLWLYGVARNVLANHGRGQQRRAQLGERLRVELREHLTHYDPTSDLVDEGAVRAVLAGLDARDREVLELTVWEQLAPREIAVALGVSSDVVRARLTRARSRMRVRLSESRYPGHDPGGGRHEPGVRAVPVPKEGTV